MQKLLFQSQRPGEPLTASQSEALARYTSPSRTSTNASRAEERHGGPAAPPTAAGSRDLGRNDNEGPGKAADVRAEIDVTAGTYVPTAAPARGAVLGAAAHKATAHTTAMAAMAATAALRPAAADRDSCAAKETRSPAEQADVMAESESEQAEEEEEEEEVEEYPGARDKARRRGMAPAPAAALTHEAALRAAALAGMAAQRGAAAQRERTRGP